MKHSKSNPKTKGQQQAEKRALAVIARMRKTGESLTAAARHEHTDPRTVLKQLGKQLRQAAPGKPYQPTKADRKARRMLSPTRKGMAPLTVRGSQQASLLGKYLSAVGEFLRTGRTTQLRKFKGKKIGGRLLITSPDALRTLYLAGELQTDDIYASPGAAI